MYITQGYFKKIIHENVPISPLSGVAIKNLIDPNKGTLSKMSLMFLQI